MHKEKRMDFSDLGKIIDAIKKNYEYICKRWEKVSGDRRINLKKRLVADIREDADVFETIWRYRALVNDETISFIFEINRIDFEKSLVTSRVKAQNSIEYKIEHYVQNHEKGKIPIKKCFNDLFGIRIVIDEIFSFEDIKKYIDKYYPEYKCIDSSKDTYTAIHIYFEKDNLSFPWELQVWSKQDEINNYKSHKEYKQEYTQWEQSSKGGGSYD